MRESGEIMESGGGVDWSHRSTLLRQRLFDGNGCGVKGTTGEGGLKGLLISLILPLKCSQWSHAKGISLEDEGGKKLVLFLDGWIDGSGVKCQS